MNIKILIIFLLTFLVIYASINSYVVLRLGELLGIGRNIQYLLITLFTLSLPIAMYLERTFPNIFSKIFYTVSALWMGVLFFTLCLLLIYEMIRPFYITPYAGMIIVIVVGVLTLISVINYLGISVREVDVPIENLKKNVTIVQLSDIHVGTIRNSKFMKNIIEKTSQLNPDIVMITGDMVDASARLHKGIFNDFNNLRAPVYFVTGNHEVMEETDKVYELFNDTKIKVLKNEVVDFEGIQIIGVEYSDDKNHLKNELEKLKINKTKPTVLMYHSPQGIEEAKRVGVDLQLAGHTHNGQIFPFNFLVKIFFKYTKGLYDLDSMFLYVSPGTGTWGPYMRLGSRNEITLLKLIPK